MHPDWYGGILWLKVFLGIILAGGALIGIGDWLRERRRMRSTDWRGKGVRIR